MNKKNGQGSAQTRLYYFFFFAAFLAGVLKICVHLRFWQLPLFFFCFGFFAYLINREKALYLFFFIFPLVNATPDLLFNGYPYNYMAVSLFLLSGMTAGSVIRRDRVIEEFRFSGLYLLFAAIVFVSALFFFLRISNITFSPLAVFRDTPVEPYGCRVSFATIFPVNALLLFHVSPFVFFFIKKFQLNTRKIFCCMGSGLIVAVCVAFYQVAVNADFLSQIWWYGKMGQVNGTFSDFNGLGVFAGIILLYFVFAVTEKFRSVYLFFVIFALAGIVLSGSRTAFVFVVTAVLVLLGRRRIKAWKKVAVVAVLAVIIVCCGGVLKHRLRALVTDSRALLQSPQKIQVLDRMLNWRITMLKNSINMFSRFPVSGVGTGNYIFFLKYQNRGNTPVLDLPLNQYLLVLSENGIAGLVLFAAFLVAVWRFQYPDKERIFQIVFLTSVFMLLVNNFLWLPEMMILFWTVLALSKQQRSTLFRTTAGRRGGLAAAAVIVILYAAGNIASFKELHPLTWAKKTGTVYDYGFWYAEKDNSGRTFRWTRGRAGLYLYAGHPCRNAMFKINCGAPLEHLKNRQQQVQVYWNGKLLKKHVFTENSDLSFSVPGNLSRVGFLEIAANPAFNLKNMGLSAETRTLGVRFFALDK